MKYTIIIATIVLFSCSNAGKRSEEVVSDTANLTPSPVADTSIKAQTISAFEMRDDSLFSDGSIPSSWKNAGITDVKGFKLFLKEMQLYIMNNDKQNLAAAVRYPLKDISNEKELVEKYDAVFTKEVKLSFATINFNQIFRNQQGAMTTGGKVWFAQLGKEFKIIAINP